MDNKYFEGAKILRFEANAGILVQAKMQLFIRDCCGFKGLTSTDFSMMHCSHDVKERWIQWDIAGDPKQKVDALLNRIKASLSKYMLSGFFYYEELNL